MKGICPLFGKVSNLLNNSLPSMYLQMISFQSLMRLEVYETPWNPPCSIVFIPRKQSPFQPLITKSYRSCSGSSLFICLTFCSENHVKLTKGNISFLKTLSHLNCHKFLDRLNSSAAVSTSVLKLIISRKKFVASENPFIWRFPFLIRLWLTFPQAELSFDSIVDKWTLKARVD